MPFAFDYTDDAVLRWSQTDHGVEYERDEYYYPSFYISVESTSLGRLYPNLDTLADMGLIEVSPIDKRTHAYSITQRGRRELEARREWEGQHVDLGDD